MLHYTAMQKKKRIMPFRLMVFNIYYYIICIIQHGQKTNKHSNLAIEPTVIPKEVQIMHCFWIMWVCISQNIN